MDLLYGDWTQVNSVIRWIPSPFLQQLAQSVQYRGRIQRKTWSMGPYAGVDYNFTLCPLQSRLQHIYHGQPCQNRIYPLVKDFDLASHKTCPLGNGHGGIWRTINCRLCAWLLRNRLARGGGGAAVRYLNSKYTTNSFHLIDQIKDNTILVSYYINLFQCCQL